MRLLRTTLLLAALGALAARASADHLLLVAFGQHFYQSQSFGPSLAQEDRFLFTALAIPDPSSSTPIGSVSVTRPDGRERGMSSPDPGGIKHFDESFSTLAWLERTYAEGAYEFRVWTAPLKSCRVPIELSGRSFPPPPRIANLDAAQSFAAESDFTVQWDPWADGSAADFVQFTVKDNSGAVVFETPFLTQPETLNGLATSALIPAGTLSPAKPYVGELLWLRSVRESTGECAEVTAQAAYYCATEFPLATSAPPPTFRPSLRRSLPSNGGSGVPVRSVVAFEFSQPMAPEVAIAWSANAQTLDWT